MNDIQQAKGQEMKTKRRLYIMRAQRLILEAKIALEEAGALEVDAGYIGKIWENLDVFDRELIVEANK